MAERPRRKGAMALSRNRRRPLRRPGRWPDATEALAALAQAWVVTTIAASLFVAALGVSQIWDTAIYLRALQDTLSGAGTLMQPIEEAPAAAPASRPVRAAQDRSD